MMIRKVGTCFYSETNNGTREIASVFHGYILVSRSTISRFSKKFNQHDCFVQRCHPSGKRPTSSILCWTTILYIRSSMIRTTITITTRITIITGTILRIRIAASSPPCLITKNKIPEMRMTARYIMTQARQ